MNPAEIIRKKRDGAELTDGQIRQFVQKFSDSQIPDYQVTAFAMAVYFQGMTDAETTSLTQHMLGTGKTLAWKPNGESRGHVVDKHSTGGIGDKVSIVLAPLLAACGVRVPMISGRGLVPTGGTLDKLESIPGFRTDLELEEIQSQVESIGCVITGATSSLVPADRKLYALRDVTATVESIPLITASIMSKKLAESLDRLVLDVKFGSGSFMKTYDQATLLAQSLVRVGCDLGVKTTALLTDMNQPLGQMVGNSIEVSEAIDCLKGGGPPDLRELVIALGSKLLDEDASPKQTLARQLDNGGAYAKFEELVAAQHGDLNRFSHTTDYFEINTRQSGFVQSIDGQAIGNTIIAMGGGRSVASDAIDHHVGLKMLVRIGDSVDVGEPIIGVHADQKHWDTVQNAIVDVVTIGDEPVDRPPLIRETLAP